MDVVEAKIAEEVGEAVYMVPHDTGVLHLRRSDITDVHVWNYVTYTHHLSTVVAENGTGDMLLLAWCSGGDYDSDIRCAQSLQRDLVMFASGKGSFSLSSVSFADYERMKRRMQAWKWRGVVVDVRLTMKQVTSVTKCTSFCGADTLVVKTRDFGTITLRGEESDGDVDHAVESLKQWVQGC